MDRDTLLRFFIRLSLSLVFWIVLTGLSDRYEMNIVTILSGVLVAMGITYLIDVIKGWG